MNLQEILGYIVLGAVSYPPLTIAVNTASMILSRKIGSQSDLDSEIEKEKKRLCLEGITIEGIIKSNTRGRFYPVGERSYVIEIGGFCANASTIRHEMNHIRRIEEGRSRLMTFDDEKGPNPLDLLKYFYSSEELSSILYEAFRIKI